MFGWLKKRIRAASLENPDTSLADPAAWLLAWAGGGMTDAGMQVSPETAMRCSAVYACVGIIAQSVATMPLDVFHRDGDDRELAREHPVYSLLHKAPNPTMTSLVFRELLMAHLLLNGNAYASIVRDRAGRPAELWPVLPSAVRVERKNGRLRYTVALEGGGSEAIDQADMLHIPGLGFDGLTGLSPIGFAAREAVGLALAAEQAGSKLFANGVRPSGVFESEAALSEEDIKDIRQGVEKNYGGTSKTGRPMLLKGGLKWKQVSMNLEDAQFIEVRQFQVEEIARIYRVPPWMIAHTEKTSSWGSGVAAQGTGFVVFTLDPWLVRAEQEFDRKLLAKDEDHFSEFNRDGLLRGDSKARSDYYSSAIQGGWMTPNEVRRRDNLPPLRGGDSLMIQTNMTPVTQLGQEDSHAD